MRSSRRKFSPLSAISFDVCAAASSFTFTRPCEIIRSSIVSVFLLDPDQDFRDRENTTIADIKRWAQELDVETFDEINLGGAQFRCAGSTEYVDWIDRFLGLTGDGSFHLSSQLTPVDSGNSPIKIDRFRPFEIELFSNPFDLEESLRERVRQGYTARLAATYSRKWKTKQPALPHLLQPEQMDFHERVEDNNGVRFWSRIWNYVPQGNDYTHFIQAPPGSKMSAEERSSGGSESKWSCACGAVT